MKTLYAKKAVVIGLRFSALIDMALALCAVLSFIAGEMGSVVFYIILMIFTAMWEFTAVDIVFKD